MSHPIRDHPATKILLWKIGALGDVVMTTPLLRQLRRQFPQARIDYLTGRGSAVVLQGNPHLDQVIGFDEEILYARRVSRLGELRRLLRGYDAVFVLDKHWIFTLLAWAARVPVRVGFARRTGEGLLHTHRVPYGALRHEIDFYLDLAQAVGLAVDRHDTRLELPPAEAYSIAGPYIVLVNSGGANGYESSEARRMPEPVFRALVDACASEATPVFLGAASEHAYYEALAAPAALNLCGRTSLPQAWSVLRGAHAVYTTDTGLMHMAAAVNPDVTAVFGPTHPQRKCPPGACWVWQDEAQYDPRYELLGTQPAGRYFASLRAEDILRAAQVS
jgi:ADP-heptose:LPS heptosyltransferase